jgi:hypothetical protein
MFTLQLVVRLGTVKLQFGSRPGLQRCLNSMKRGLAMVTHELELRRLTLVLAGQLPSELHDARLVVTMLQSLVDNFLAVSFEEPSARVVRAPTTRGADGGN